MTKQYSSNKAAQRAVIDSAAALSGQQLPDNSGSSAPQQGMSLIQAWARKVQDIIRLWQGYLSGDRDESIDLMEISDMKISMQSLREGLTTYLFEDDAQLRSIEPSAWEGIQRDWILVKLNSDALWNEIVYYRDWMIQIDKRGDQIADPMAMRKMARTMRDDTRTIVDLYAKLADNLLPIIKEILELP
jgi:hypothetical protein